MDSTRDSQQERPSLTWMIEQVGHCTLHNNNTVYVCNMVAIDVDLNSAHKQKRINFIFNYIFTLKHDFLSTCIEPNTCTGFV